jgi:twitching motility protein PilT
MLRLNHELVPLSGELMIPSEAKKAFESITSEKQQKAFYSELELDFAHSISGIGRLEVNASMQRGSIALAVGCLSGKVHSMEELGLPDICKTLIMERKGSIPVTGPTSSGKSTTQAAMIDYLNGKAGREVVTVEDPIEYLYSNRKCLIIQRELDDDTASFTSAMRHALRQNSDVILVGEMRDVAAIAAAISAAETGHRVLATAHTQGAANVISLLISQFPSVQQDQVRAQLALTLEAVLSQLLVPRAGGKGRVAIFEIMLASYAIRNLIWENETTQISSSIETSSQQGMQTLDQALEGAVRNGIIELEEAPLRAKRPEELEKAFPAYHSCHRGKEPVGRVN